MRATVTFHDISNGHAIFGEPMEARWAGSPEPVFPRIRDLTGKETSLLYDVERILAPSRVDIYPGESETLDLAVRYDGEDQCFGWNNESYFNNMRNPRYPEF